MNTVDYLIKKPFSSHSLSEKLSIKLIGRPKPDLQINQNCTVKNKCVKRKFNPAIYAKHDWLCGCDIRNALFCFPCLLFGGEISWTQNGVTDLKHLSEKIHKHTASLGHKNSVMDLAVLGMQDIRSRLSSAYTHQIELHNKQVRENRYVLSLLINCVRFCGAYELALRGHDESETSINQGIFRGLVNFTAELNESMKDHLQKATVFKGTSKTIQNELLDCMLQVCHDHISQEIKGADFVSIIADETTDVSNIFQMVLVYRYIINDKVVERFWRFLNPEKHDAEALSSCILKELDGQLKDTPNKLISQSYDGASVMSGKERGVQSRVRQHYPLAFYVHCHAHQLNLIMSQAASINRGVRVFFANLDGIASFFSKSSQRTKILDDVVGRRLPRTAPTRWNFHSRVVLTVHEYREELIECMNEIQTGREIKQSTTISQANGLKHILCEEGFVFWLQFFYRIMPHVDILYNQLQKRLTDPVQVKSNLQMFENHVTKTREYLETRSSEKEINGGSRKRSHEQMSESKLREAKEVCDVIVTHAKDRFSFTGHFSVTNLFVSEKFPEYDKSFPLNHLNNAVEAFPFLDRKKLETELGLVYKRREFRSVSGAVPMLKFIMDTNIVSTFEETVKLLKIISTIPMSTSEAERCFSTLKRIKTFLRNTMEQDRLSSLAMLSIERNLVMEISDFNNKVIERFVQIKDRRLDFTFKV